MNTLTRTLLAVGVVVGLAVPPLSYMFVLRAEAAAPAAGSWTRGPRTLLTDSGTVVAVLRPTNGGGTARAYYDEDGTVNSDTINVENCSDIGHFFNPDEDGSNTGALVRTWVCEEAHTDSTTSGCIRYYGDRNLDSVVDATDDITLDGTTIGRSVERLPTPGPFVMVEVTANAGSDDLRFVLTCFP